MIKKTTSSKKKTSEPELSKSRKQYIGNGRYTDKDLNQVKTDGNKFTKHSRCLTCKCRLTIKEFARLGLSCYDHY